eukprot:869017-Rhodomonas_salina.2
MTAFVNQSFHSQAKTSVLLTEQGSGGHTLFQSQPIDLLHLFQTIQTIQSNVIMDKASSAIAEDAPSEGEPPDEPPEKHSSGKNIISLAPDAIPSTDVAYGASIWEDPFPAQKQLCFQKFQED